MMLPFGFQESDRIRSRGAIHISKLELINKSKSLVMKQMSEGESSGELEELIKRMQRLLPLIDEYLKRKVVSESGTTSVVEDETVNHQHIQQDQFRGVGGSSSNIQIN